MDAKMRTEKVKVVETEVLAGMAAKKKKKPPPAVVQEKRKKEGLGWHYRNWVTNWTQWACPKGKRG